MKELSTEFLGKGSQKGFQFNQITRNNKVAIYSKKDKDKTYYEVMGIKSHNRYKLGGVAFPPAETYPGDNAFGVSAWCFSTLVSAESKLIHLLNKNCS